MNSTTVPKSAGVAGLCLECGLCCNGVIFADVKLRRGDRPAALRDLGVPVVRARSRATRRYRVCQPCAAWVGDRCRIYKVRPAYCREFDCLLLKEVKAGRMTMARARGSIRAARKRAETVLRLLRLLGDAEEHLPLSARFRRMARQCERRKLDPEAVDCFGELTVAVQQLTLLLSQAFYPGHPQPGTPAPEAIAIRPRKA